MAFTDPRAVFGIHSIVPYDRTTFLPFGILRVLGGGEISLEAERVDLFGGSNRFPFVSEATIIDSEFTFTAKEYPDFVFELFLDASITTTAAEASGSITALTNQVGTSVSDGTTGIASADTTTAADLKYGRYLVVATGAATVDVFAHSNVDATKGTDLAFIDDSMKVTASPLTVPGSSSTVAVPSLGLDLTGGSGTIAFVTDDSAFFDVLPIHQGVSSIVVGKAGTTFPEFGARMMAAKLSSGDIFELNAFKANGAGMPIALTENEFAEPELSMQLLFDSAEDAVFEITAVDVG